MLRDRTRRSKSKLAPIAALIFAAMTGAALTAMPANAGTVPTIDCTTDANVFNTAYDNSPTATGPLLTGPDANWKVTSVLGAPGTDLNSPTDAYADAVVVDAPPLAWFTPSSKAGWISHQADADQSAKYVDRANADYFYKFDFALAAAVDAPSFALNMSFYADNSVAEIYVNGVAQSVAGGGTIAALPTGGELPYMYEGYKQDTATNVVLNQNWQTGNNSLVVKIQSGWNKEGFGATISGVPTCKPPMEVISAQAICDDEHPKSLLITGTGFDATTTVKIGDVEATVTSYTETTLIATIPKLSKGWVDVTVTKGEFVLTLTDGFLVGCECAEEEHHSEEGDHHSSEGDHHSSEGDHHSSEGDHHSSEGDHHSDKGDHHSERGNHRGEPSSAPTSSPSASPSEGHHEGDHSEEPEVLCEIVIAPAAGPAVLNWTLPGAGIQRVAAADEATVASEPVADASASIAADSAPEATSPEPSAPEASTPVDSTPEATTPEASTPEASTPSETPVAPVSAVETPIVETPVDSPDAVERQMPALMAFSSFAVSPKVKSAVSKAKRSKIKAAKAMAKAAKIKSAKAKIKALKLSKKH